MDIIDFSWMGCQPNLLEKNLHAFNFMQTINCHCATARWRPGELGIITSEIKRLQKIERKSKLD